MTTPSGTPAAAVPRQVATAYDSVSPGKIPRGALMAIGYANGLYAWPEPAWAQFPDSRKARIDVIGNDPGQASILDVERYDATPAHAAEWVPARDRFRPGTATIYCDLAALPDVFTAIMPVNAGSTCWIWLGDWTGTPHVPTHHKDGSAIVWPHGIELAAVQYVTVIDQYDITAVYSQRWLDQHSK